MKLGHKQSGMLEAMVELGGWNPDARPGWVWDTPSGTHKIVDSLVKKGLVKYNYDLGRFMITEAGKEELK